MSAKLESLFRKAPIIGFSSVMLMILVQQPVTGATNVVVESFGGSSTDPLNGTTADVFASGITSAGGSSTWVAATTSQFNADGSITPFSTFDGIAYLDMGSYIDNAKGTAVGLFRLGLTIAPATQGNWVGLGFTNVLPTSTSDMFLLPNPIGLGWGGYNRTPSQAFFYAGPGNADLAPTLALGAGPHDFVVTLDLTTYDGITDFGHLSYSVDGAPLVGGDFSYTSANQFRTIAISQDNAANGTVSNFFLEQIPEPGSGLLMVAGSGLVLLRRRRG
ncbi:MAG: PEP-CTERM sorting domain-containing protein [Verrucomicrobiota bacterium]